MIFDHHGAEVARHLEHEHPAPLVSTTSVEIWERNVGVDPVLNATNLSPKDAALGLPTNVRRDVPVWNRQYRTALTNAIVWQIPRHRPHRRRWIETVVETGSAARRLPPATLFRRQAAVILENVDGTARLSNL